VRQLRLPTQGKVKIINMEMNDIEFIPLLPDLLEHENVVSQTVLAPWVGAKRTDTGRHQPRGRKRVSAGKQRDTVPLAN
jgi:hypothetical protein